MRPKVGGVLDDALALLTLFETVALVQMVIYPYTIYNSGTFAGSEAVIIKGLVPLSPLLLVILLYSWAIRLFVQSARKRSAWLNKFVQTMSALVRGSHSRSLTEQYPIVLRYPRLVLLLSVATAGLLGYLPYSPCFNPSGNIVGIDTPAYIEWARQMVARPPLQALSYAFGAADRGFRPLPLIILYSIASLGVNPDQLVKFSPVALGPLLSLSSYLFVNSSLKDRRAAAIAALVACFSFNVTVGIWAGYIANWLAVILAYLFTTGFLVFERSNRRVSLLGPALLSAALLLTHPWTWALALTATLVFAVTRHQDERKPLAVAAVALIVVGIVTDLLKNLAAGGTTLAADLGTKGPVFGLQEISMFWPNLIGALTVFYDGLLGNVLLLGLSALPFVGIASRDKLKALLACWVATASIPFALLNSFHQSRLIYDLPIPPLATIGLLVLFSRAGGGNLRATLIFLVVMLFGANYAVSSIIQA